MREKIYAFQRAVELFTKRKILASTQLSKSHLPIADDETHALLMKLHPHLIKILLLCIDTKVEALKTSVLRSLEFLIDQLGCSLEVYLVEVIIAVIKAYPRSNSQTLQPP
jgi:hypothetical protein